LPQKNIKRPSIDQMVIKYLYQHLPLQDSPKFIQIGIFGSEICHLATLVYLMNLFHAVKLTEIFWNSRILEKKFWPKLMDSEFLKTRGRCFDQDFLRFLTIFCEKFGVFLKNRCYD
jgi:hypothetical protein